ncbi:MAG: hypothetical protein JWO68_3396 [Actinomycetia bacterium]|nr:hypothetical protein [Actinomycetes bacterium]
MSMDDLVEGIGRRLASRTTRRTLLGRAAKLGVLVAGGPALATLLVDRAEARQCGQSGVSPRCPTFDCTGPGSVWGWCWYASPGCCSGGGLKKICVCCTAGWPNVHGYCPSGHNVRCMVESCYADPRVMYVPILRAPGYTGPSVAAARARLGAAGSGGVVVIGDADNALLAAVAAAVAGAIDAPLLLTPADHLAPAVPAEIQRRKAVSAIVLATVPAAFDDELKGYGISAIERIGEGFTIEACSVTAAHWLRERTGSTEAVCVATEGLSAAAAPAAAAFAGANKLPLLLGAQSARDHAAPGGTWMVGLDGTDVPGARPVGGGSKEDLALTLATLTVEHYHRRDLTVHVAPSGAPDISVGLAGGAGTLLYHPAGVLGPAVYGWINNHRAAVSRAVIGGSVGTLGDQGTYDLQSALHHFDTHRLQGVSGQGLPVRSQPREERPLGRARVAGVEPDTEPSYWAARADVRRHP